MVIAMVDYLLPSYIFDVPMLQQTNPILQYVEFVVMQSYK